MTTIRGLTPDASPNTTVRSFASWLYGGFALVLVLTGLLIWVWLRQPPVVESGADHAGDPAMADLPAVLVVTEMQVVDGTSRVIRERERVPVVPGAPVIVGSNPDSCTLLVAPVTGVEEPELFRVTLTPNGRLTLTAIPGALCEGNPLPRRGLSRTGDRPLRIQIADREWMIVLSFDDGNLTAVHDLFARVPRDAAADARRPESPEAGDA